MEILYMDELLNNPMAAQLLAERLPERSAERWRIWLQNNRNQSRQVPYRIPFVRLGGGTFYSPDELEKFVEFERARHIGRIKLSGRTVETLRAFGIGEVGGSTLGRAFKGGSANPHPNNNGGAFVQATINEPLTVFAMTPQQAISFGEELIEAGKAAQRITNGQQAPSTPNFTATTITDNADCFIQRREYNK